MQVEIEGVEMRMDGEAGEELEERYLTSPGPNLEQKVPSALPNLRATQSLTSMVSVGRK